MKVDGTELEAADQSSYYLHCVCYNNQYLFPQAMININERPNTTNSFNFAVYYEGAKVLNTMSA